MGETTWTGRWGKTEKGFGALFRFFPYRFILQYAPQSWRRSLKLESTCMFSVTLSVTSAPSLPVVILLYFKVGSLLLLVVVVHVPPFHFTLGRTMCLPAAAATVRRMTGVVVNSLRTNLAKI